MADDFAIPVPGGTVIAADEVGGKKYQRVKLTHGDDGSAVDAGPTNPLPVEDAQLAGVVGQAVDTTLDTTPVLRVQPIDKTGALIEGGGGGSAGPTLDFATLASHNLSTTIAGNASQDVIAGVIGSTQRVVVVGYQIAVFYNDGDHSDVWEMSIRTLGGDPTAFTAVTLPFAHLMSHSYAGTWDSPAFVMPEGCGVRFTLGVLGTESATTAHVYGNLSYYLL